METSIIEKHINRLHDFENVEEAMEVIDDVVKSGKIVKNKWDKATIEKDGYRVVVRKNLRDDAGNITDSKKRWVVTAFDNNRSAKEKEASATTRATPGDNQGGRAVTPNASSTDKVSDFSSNLQGKGGKKSAMGGDSEGAMEPRQTERENAVEAGTAAPRLSEKEVRRGVKDHVRKWNGVLNEDNIETVGDAMRWVYTMAAETRRQYSRETGHKMGLDYSRLLDKDDSHGRKIDTSKAKYYLTHIEAMAERMKERLESAIAKTKSDAPRRALEETLAELERTVKWYRRAANGDVSYSLAFCNVAFFRDVGFGVGHMVCLMGCCNAAAYRTRG